MKFWRVSSFLLSLCFICLTVSVPALAAGSDDLSDLPIQDFVIPGTPAESFAPMQRPDLVEPQPSEGPPQLLAPSESDVGLMAAAEAEAENVWRLKTPWSLAGDSPVYFGHYASYHNAKFSGYDGTILNGAETSLQIYTTTDDRQSLAYAATRAYTIDVQTTCSFDQNDYPSVRFNGQSGFSFTVQNDATHPSDEIITVWPDTIQLLINGEPYGDAVPLNDGLNVEVPLEEGGIPLISSYGFRYGFPKYEIQKTTTYWQEKVRLSCWFDATAFSAGGTSALNGLLSGILGVIQSILNAIVSLPGNIASAIGNILRDLFIPSEQDMQAILESFQTRLGEKLGFLYTAGSTIYDLVSGIYDALHESAAGFRFPGISVKLNGQVHVIAPEQDVVISENTVVSTVQSLFRPLLVAVFALYLINLCHDMYECIISGYSYMDFLHRGKGGED